MAKTPNTPAAPGNEPPDASGQPNPLELIARLDMRTVDELNSQLTGPWRRIVRRERVNREESLEALRTYMPNQTEAPTFEPQAIDTYFTQARWTNNHGPQTTDQYKLRPARTWVNKLAAAYINRPDTVRRLTGLAEHAQLDRLGISFASNLYGVTATARSIAMRSFQAQRNALLRTYFAGAPLVGRRELKEYARTQPITNDQIQQAKEAILALPYQAPYPDFFQLTDPERQMIIEALGKEWEDMYKLVQKYAPTLLNRTINLKAAPLAYLSTEDLQGAIANNPEIGPQQICFAFLRNPQNFYTRLQQLQQQAAEALRTSSLDRPSTARPEKTKNQHEIALLLRAPEANPDVQHMTFGSTVALTTPSTATSEPEFVYRSQLASTIDINLLLLARSLYERLPGHNPRGATVWNWHYFNVGEALRAGFAGPMSDLAVTLLPVSQEDLTARLKHTSLRPEDVYEVVFTVNMHSTGRGPNPAMLRLMLVVHTGAPKDKIAKSRWRPRSTGAGVVASLRAEASAVARVVEAYHQSHPLAGGLPELDGH